MMNTSMIWILVACLALGCNGADTATDQDKHEPDSHANDTESLDDEHDEHEDEGIVVLTAEQMEGAGIFTVRAAPGSVELRLDLSAVVSANLDARAHVTPHIDGHVHAVHAGLGQEVSAGDLLCEVESVGFGRLASAYVTANATLQLDEGILAGELAVLERNVELAQEVFDRELELAEQGLATLSSRYAAESRLQEARLRRDSRTLELEARISRDRIALVAAERELEILGVTHDALADMVTAAQEGHTSLGLFPIHAPRDGVIVSRNVSEAEHVDTESVIFGIQDLSTVWVMGSVYEQDLASVRVGASAEVRLDAHPGQVFAGHVAFIDTTISQTTRAAAVRVVLENAPLDSWPEPYPVRPGMFGRVALTTGEVEAEVVIPESALVHDAPAGDFVFVEAEPGTFEQRAVRIGARTPDRVEILSGLSAGESVAAGGTFILKSASRSDELGEDDDH